jgi:hypothetical protein
VEGEAPPRPEGSDDNPGVVVAPVDEVIPPPPTAPPDYVPPPGLVPPPATAYATPQGAPRQGGSRRWLVIGLVVVLLIGILGGGAAFANASLASTYSPQQAVTDYFAAQGRGDVTGMLANATYLNGDPTYAPFFGNDALAKMVSLSQNTAISHVNVISTKAVDSATSTVTVSMTWSGNVRTHTYIVRKDTSRVHYFFYDSWRVEIPFVTIAAILPPQAGAIEVDGMSLPAGAPPTAIQVIEGYHSVAMLSSDFYDGATQIVYGVDGNPAPTFLGTIKTSFRNAAATSIKAAFLTCDPAQYSDCIDHTYPVKAGYYDALTGFPGYSEIDVYSAWSFAFSSDPTAGMALVVTTAPGKLTAGGKCAVTMTVDGSTHYNFSGSWAATLDYKSGTFTTVVEYNCTAQA